MSAVTQEWDNWLTEIGGVNFEQAFEEQLCADFKIIVGDQTIMAHSFVLTAQSQVFQIMFKRELAENKDNEVMIVDVEYEPMRALVKFLYPGKVDFGQSVEFAWKVLRAADKYDVPKLESVCQDFLRSQLTDEDVLRTVVEASKGNAAKLMTGCYEYLTSLDETRLAAIKAADEWTQLSEDIMIRHLWFSFSVD